MCLVFLGYLINAYIEKKDAGQPVTSEEEVVGRCTTDDLTIKDITWHEEAKGAPAIIDSITVTNRGNYDCKDIRGHIRFLSKDGAELGKNDFIVSEYIHSKETKTYKRIPVKSVQFSNVHNITVTLEGTVVRQEKK